MTENHPITPPPELVEQWDSECESDIDAAMHLATKAARWGADQELEACCEFEATVYSTDCADKLRRHRRPKPPSLKEKLKEAIYNENLSDALRLAEQLDDSL